MWTTRGFLQRATKTKRRQQQQAVVEQLQRHVEIANNRRHASINAQRHAMQRWQKQQNQQQQVSATAVLTHAKHKSRMKKKNSKLVNWRWATAGQITPYPSRLAVGTTPRRLVAWSTVVTVFDVFAIDESADRNKITKKKNSNNKNAQAKGVLGNCFNR